MKQAASAGFRTSPQQRFLWSAFTFAPWVQLAAAIDGPLDFGRLGDALRAAAARHEILRTSIHPGAAGDPSSGPVQVIAAEADGLVSVEDIAAPAGDLDALCAVERSLVDVAAGPSFRVAVRRSSGQCVLIMTAHPMVADRRSLRVVLGEVAAIYAGQPAAPAPVQYADFAAWHNDLLTDENRAAERDYWDARLKNGSIAHAGELAHGQPPAGPGSSGEGEWRSHRRDLNGELGAAIRKLAGGTDDDGHRVEAVFAAAWAVLLWRLRGEHDDIVLPAALPGRPYPELAIAAGPYTRYAPVVFGFTGEDPFDVIVDRAQAVLSDSSQHADDLDPALAGGDQALDWAAFEYLDDPAVVTAGEVSFRPVREESREPAALILRGGTGAAGLWAEIGHDTRRVAVGQADELLERFEVMLRAATAAPSVAAAALPACLPGEQDRLLAAGRGPVAVAPSGQTLPGLFHERAVGQPDAVAIEYGGTLLSYGELDARSNQLARYLVARGVRPADRVVVHAGLLPDFVVAILGVVKAGAAYVPVDTRTPWQRVEFVLRDTGAAALLTHGSRPAGPDGIPVIALDADWPDIAAQPTDTLPGTVAADAVAYLMYTSGTTGTPNGVPVTHRALLNYLLWAVSTYDLGAGTGSLVHSSVGFDLTVTALLGPLLAGQRVILLPAAPGLGGLVAGIRAARDLTLVKLTPSHLRALCQLMEPEEFAGRIRTLVVGGEQLRAELLQAFRAGAPGMRIFNEYGPTETVVGSCVYEVAPGAPHRGPVPIGRPIAGTSIYLLDPAGQLVPDGMPGEIYIAGAGVSAGYLNRPELTRERFLPDPFAGGPDPSAGSTTMYRTGDRGRWAPGVGLVYLGRLDRQLKVRGVRVEPGEIEDVLCRHPDVGQAAVVVYRPAGDESPQRLADEARLTAYVVPRDGRPAPDPSELARLCRDCLPDYLIPGQFVPLAALPMTPNGKLDAGALPDPRLVAAPGSYVPPRTETEEILCGALATVLGRERVGIDDNYFVIGGDSIRSVMVASRARARGADITVPDLHRHPTVRELAAATAASPGRVEEPKTQPFSLISAADRALMPPDVEDAFPLNLLQEGMIFHRNFAAKSAVYHAIASVRLRAPFDLDVMRLVIRQLVERHPLLRTSFDLSTFSRPLELVHKTFKDPLSYQDLRGLPPADQEAQITGWVAQEKERGFELDEHPLIRFMAQRLDDETFQFTYGFHHEIVDGWSEALLVTELFGHYFSVVFDEPVVIKPPSSSMRDAVALELEALKDQDGFDFWARYLDGATLMRLPRLSSGPSADRGAREIVRIAVPVRAELSDRLKQLAGANAVPLKSVLLAAHMMVMCQYNGHLDTLTYTVTNGRPETADGSTAIGLFVNSLAIRLALTGGTWNDLITQTFETERQSLKYRRLPMAELKRHQGNEPLAETLFFFTDYHVFGELQRWQRRGVEHVTSELYGESTFPFCAIFRLNRDNSRLEVRIEYDSLQFPAALMDAIADCYVRVLETMTADPESFYHTQSLLSDTELRRSVVDWNGTAPDSGDAHLIHRLIERHASETPDAVAIVSGESAVSYRELDHRANRIAAALKAHGAGPERVVALMTERSVEAIAAMLGTLKAGAAYLPLDPAFPPERIAAIVRDARPAVALSQPEHVGLLPSLPVLALHPDCEPLPDQALTDEPPADQAGPPPAPGCALADSAAYVIYTSGSTGEPKGVVVTHRGLLNSTLARDRHYAQPPGRFLLLSPLVFDSSAAGLFWTLCTGGTLVLPPYGAQLEPATLARLIAGQHVTHTLAVPSLLSALLDQRRPELLQSLRTVISAGEPCPKELWTELRAVLPDAVLHNEYGPTENTIWSTVWAAEPVAYRTQVPIGRPVAGVQAYVLNPHLQPVPGGVAGELYLGGAGLARGYLGSPGLTAARFRPDPFRSGARMYASGDLARHAANGDLEFLGRVDKQVKIRGFRVELGEIEGTLDLHPAVRRSVVVSRQDDADGTSLAAYVVLVPGSATDGAELQQFVRDRLPRYMVPARCTVLDELPLTPTGKVDVASLPAPVRSGPGGQPVSPRTEAELLLCAVWCQVLGLDQVGVQDEFFEIGGESLRAMQVVTKVNKVLDLDLPVRSLFDAPTIEEFARVVEMEQACAGTGGVSSRL